MTRLMEKSIAEQLKPIFEPRSVAVIGASADMGKFGGRAFLHPLHTGYRGALYPVNSNRAEVAGVKAYPSILDIPDEVDLAVLAVAAQYVPQIMEDCVKKGVKGAVMITAGFAEIGEEGKRLEEEVVRIAHRGGIRFVGPNCNGIWTSRVRLNLTFDFAPQPGPISFISQSGTLGGYLFQVATSKGYGFSKFVSSGNQASLGMADYVEYLGQDDDTRVIVLYMEGIQGGRRLFEVAREVVKRKPIVLYKGGRTAPGSRATKSHTASLAGSDEVFEALCRQAGLIRCYEAMHPFDIAEALSYQPVPRGTRVTIIGSGGQCVTTTDACASMGLELPEFDDDTKRRLKSLLAEHAPVPTNPIDTAATPDPMIVAKILEVVCALDYIDGVICSGPMAGWRGTADDIRNTLAQAEALISIPKKYGKSLVCTAMRWHRSEMGLDLMRQAGIPYYTTPEESARAMWGLMRYGEIRRQVGADV